MRTKTLSRRGFLRRGLLVGGGLAAASGFGLSGLSRFARAADDAAVSPDLVSDRYFIFCYFSGGWDILLGLDPRDPAKFTTANLAATRIQPGYEELDEVDASNIEAGGITFGPFIGDLAGHADKLCVVRGLSAETLTHEVGRRRHLTGKAPSGLAARGSSIATLLAGTLGQADPVPNLSVRVESYNVDMPNYATGLKVQSVPDLVEALAAKDPSLDPTQDMLLDQVLTQWTQCSAYQKSPLRLSAEESRQKAREMSRGGYDKRFDFLANTDEMAALRDHYGIGTNSAALSTPEAQAAMAVTAITTHLSRVVSVQIASGLDTHFENWTSDQGPRQRQGFDAIARMIEDLAARPYTDILGKPNGDSWLDHVTIIGFSEFGRTSMLNDNTGRDHSLTTACLLAGAGIKGGQVVGRSSDVALSPMTIDLASGQPSPEGEIIKPEHIMRALIADVGVEGDPFDLRVDPLTAILT